MNTHKTRMIRVGDLVQKKRSGRMGLVLTIINRNRSGDIMWLSNGNIENCSVYTKFWQVINESGSS